MTSPGLAALLSPQSIDDFNACLEANEPFAVENAAGIGKLTGLPIFSSLEKLFQTWPYSVQAHLPKIADEASAIDVSVTDAKKLFENGMGLMFEQAERISPELTTWLEAIRIDLGLSSLTQARCLLYATPDGKGTAPHFDQNLNFILQLKGAKKWRLASNSHVVNPLTRFTMGLEMDSEMQTYADGPMPQEMPSHAKTVVLRPGTVLFVPRGMWHSTEAEGDALSLNFTYSAPSWVDLFTAALRSRLVLSPEWRAIAAGVADPLRRQEAEASLDRLLAGLKQDLPNWNADEILAATDGR